MRYFFTSTYLRYLLEKLVNPKDQVIRIMQGVCDATQSKVIEEAVIALQTLVKLGSYYYDYLLNFMDSITEVRSQIIYCWF